MINLLVLTNNPSRPIFRQRIEQFKDHLYNRSINCEFVKYPSSFFKRIGILKKSASYDAVFINLHIVPRYGSLRMFGKLGGIFWNSFWLDHDCVVFTSFGDPYKIFEMPSVPNMVNVFSNTPSSQKAAVQFWLGEIEAEGKSPIKLDGFFDIEV